MAIRVKTVFGEKTMRVSFQSQGERTGKG